MLKNAWVLEGKYTLSKLQLKKKKKKGAKFFTISIAKSTPLQGAEVTWILIININEIMCKRIIKVSSFLLIN